jgi:response regulator NasT
MTVPLRIIVADDEPDMQEYFAKVLPRMGHEVVAVAVTGRQLVEECRARRPDLVITDLLMPDLDGLSAAELVQRELGVPVIVVSALAEPVGPSAGGGGPYDFYLVKPVKQRDLASAIAAAARQPPIRSASRTYSSPTG